MPARNRGDRHTWAHRRTRAALIPTAIGTRCPGAILNGNVYHSPHCVGVMTHPSHMHLDHTQPVALGGTHGDRIICKPCNLSAGAKLGNHLRPPQPSTRPPRHSRTW